MAPAQLPSARVPERGMWLRPIRGHHQGGCGLWELGCLGTTLALSAPEGGVKRSSISAVSIDLRIFHLLGARV